MKFNIKKVVAFSAISLASVSMLAQNTRTGYFVDDYTYRFQMNPAMGNSRNFIGIPGLSNVNVGVHGNLHLDNVLYNINGKTTTFMNPLVSANQFLGNLSDVNRLGTDLKLNVISFGFKGMGGYNTFSINARASFDAHLPKSIFSLAKEGLSNQVYDITDLGVRAIGYAEVSLGHSRDINSEWRVGANLKILVGGGAAEAKLNRAYLELGENEWRVSSDGELTANVKGLTFDHKTNENTGHEYVSGADIDGAGINGFGFAVDLGAVYKPSFVKGLTLSASLLDLGFINWKNNMLASTNGVQSFTTDKYTFNVDKDAPNNFDDEFDKLKDDFSSIYEFNDMGDTGSKSQMLHATFNIGGEYKLPVYNKVSFGLLNTTCIAGPYTWTDFRLSANYAPAKVFSCAASIAEGTYGFGFGWMLNLHAPGFNFFVGMDHTMGKLAKQGVPLSSNASVNLGWNVLF